jgi:hypothetical protein
MTLEQVSSRSLMLYAQIGGAAVVGGAIMGLTGTRCLYTVYMVLEDITFD